MAILTIKIWNQSNDMVIQTVVIFPGQMLQQSVLNAYHQMQLQVSVGMNNIMRANMKTKEFFVSGKECRCDTWEDCSLVTITVRFIYSVGNSSTGIVAIGKRGLLLNHTKLILMMMMTKKYDYHYH
eukprot:8073982-Ditylum_brightwellii.AAC.1